MKTRFIAVLLASLFFWTPGQPNTLPQERAATEAQAETCPSRLQDWENIFTYDFVGQWRRAIVRRVLAVCKYDFRVFDAELDESYPPDATIHINFGLASTSYIGTWNENNATISLSERCGVKGSGLRGCSGVLFHELGHGADSLVLMNDNENRRDITAAFCRTGKHQWWSGSYYSSTGEAFADAFAAMYGGDLRPWGRGTWGHHNLTRKVRRVIRRILEGN